LPHSPVIQGGDGCPREARGVVVVPDGAGTRSRAHLIPALLKHRANRAMARAGGRNRVLPASSLDHPGRAMDRVPGFPWRCHSVHGARAIGHPRVTLTRAHITRPRQSSV
jgi:hypothetical protein